MLTHKRPVEDAIAFLLVGTLSGSAALSSIGQFSTAIKSAVVGCGCALLSHAVLRVGEAITTRKPPKAPGKPKVTKRPNSKRK